ncbi:MAG: hypothetical protein ABSG15_14735 [FCB group bacterium]|jgi:hypothetical protein
MKLLKFIAILFCILGISSKSYSQNVIAKASLDTTKGLIGDQFKLKLEVQSDKKTNIILPAMPDSIGKLEILSRSKIDTVDSNGKYSLRQQFVMTCFDTGWYEIPALTVMYEKNGMPSPYPIETLPLHIRFNTVQVDTSLAIKDIKSPLDIPISIWEYLLYFLIVILAAAAGVGGYLLWKRYKKRQLPKPKYDPRIPPHIYALEALKQLDDEKLWQKGKVKLYYIRLTEIIRTYLERSFYIPALEMITSEIIEAMLNAKIDMEFVERMGKVFETADLVKFAKYQPLPDVNTLSMNLSIDFVKGTIPSEAVQKAEAEGN